MTRGRLDVGQAAVLGLFIGPLDFLPFRSLARSMAENPSVEKRSVPLESN